MIFVVSPEAQANDAGAYFLSVVREIVSGMSGDPVSVRLVEWNVAMSLHTKARCVAILPESAHPNKTGQVLEEFGATPGQWQWAGSNINKGLLAVAFEGWNLRIDGSYDPAYQWVMPSHITGLNEIRILAVWDMGGHETARRIGSCRASIEHYAEFLSRDSSTCACPRILLKT